MAVVTLTRLVQAKKQYRNRYAHCSVAQKHQSRAVELVLAQLLALYQTCPPQPQGKDKKRTMWDPK